MGEIDNATNFFKLMGLNGSNNNIIINNAETFTTKQLEKIIKGGSKKLPENWMRYADFEIHPIKDESFDIQETYIKLLCLVSSKSGEMTKQQNFIIDYLVEVIDSDMDIDEYIDEAEDLDDDDIDTFLSEIANQDISYNFVVDMLLIAKLGATADNLEELVNYCGGITDRLPFKKGDVEVLILLIRSIYSESSSILSRIKDDYCSGVYLEWFDCYISDYDTVD
jgi:hypothetical protein